MQRKLEDLDELLRQKRNANNPMAKKNNEESNNKKPNDLNSEVYTVADFLKEVDEISKNVVPTLKSPPLLIDYCTYSQVSKGGKM